LAYQFDFSGVAEYGEVLAKGVGLTVTLIGVGGVLGTAVGIFGAWARGYSRIAWLSRAVGAYVELVRNTPFLVQAALIAVTVNLGAYATEIIRAGIEAVPRGQHEAGASLAMTRLQVFRHVVLRPALQKIWPALSSQLVIVMFGSAVCSQIAVEELTYAANFIQSRNFRAFEMYFVATAIYFVLAILLRQLMRAIGAWFVFGAKR